MNLPWMTLPTWFSRLALKGLIVSNTTTARPVLQSANASQQGGLSGKPLFAPSTEILRKMRQRVGNRIVLVGVGGIASGADAYAKIRAGASLVQLYTALVYEGPDWRHGSSGNCWNC